MSTSRQHNAWRTVCLRSNPGAMESVAYLKIIKKKAKIFNAINLVILVYNLQGKVISTQ